MGHQRGTGQPRRWRSFGAIGLAATVGGILRGHLLFIERVNPRALAAERRRTEPITLVIDTVIAGGLVVDSALLFVLGRSLAAVLIAGLGIGIVLTRLDPRTVDHGRGVRPLSPTAEPPARVFRMSRVGAPAHDRRSE